MRFFGKKRRLERKFSRQVERQGFNFQCDVGLAARVRLAAKLLEVPIYPLMEEIVERGLSDVGEIVQDDTLKERLQRHLLTDHLLVDHLEPEHETVSSRALRLRNAMRFLELCETLGLNPLEIKQVLDQFLAEAKKKRA